MRIAIGADHAGFEMKRDLAGHLARSGHEVIDLGTHSTAPVDYPDISEAVAQAVRNGQADRGIVVCGSGAGAAIAACKFPGIRAVRLSRRLLRAPGGGARRSQRALSRLARDRTVAGAHAGRCAYLAAAFSRRGAAPEPRSTKIDAIESRYSREE